MHCSPFGTQSPQFFIIVCVYAVKKRKNGDGEARSVDRMKAKEWEDTSPFDMILRERKKSCRLIPKVYRKIGR